MENSWPISTLPLVLRLFGTVIGSCALRLCRLSWGRKQVRRRVTLSLKMGISPQKNFVLMMSRDGKQGRIRRSSNKTGGWGHLCMHSGQLHRPAWEGNGSLCSAQKRNVSIGYNTKNGFLRYCRGAYDRLWAVSSSSHRCTSCWLAVQRFPRRRRWSLRLWPVFCGTYEGPGFGFKVFNKAKYT